MQQTNFWWKTLFKGHLAPGLNEEKMDELSDESFLYFQQNQYDDNSRLNEDFSRDANLRHEHPLF